MSVAAADVMNRRRPILACGGRVRGKSCIVVLHVVRETLDASCKASLRPISPQSARRYPSVDDPVAKSEFASRKRGRRGDLLLTGRQTSYCRSHADAEDQPARKRVERGGKGDQSRLSIAPVGCPCGGKPGSCHPEQRGRTRSRRGH